VSDGSRPASAQGCERLDEWVRNPSRPELALAYEKAWDEVEVSKSASQAALNVVRRLSRQKDELNAQWTTAIRLAQANGASLRDIAEVAGVAPQTVSKICKD
jgi:DNA-directed RNA polymerase specialized sigma24 family protein